MRMSESVRFGTRVAPLRSGDTDNTTRGDKIGLETKPS